MQLARKNVAVEDALIRLALGGGNHCYIHEGLEAAVINEGKLTGTIAVDGQRQLNGAWQVRVLFDLERAHYGN